MDNFFDDTMQGLLEAVEIEKGSIPLTERKEMPASTFYVSDNDTELINRLVEIRKNENVSQSELARMVGSKQQAISRLEKNEHSPSLKLFYSMVNALGYELQIVKKQNI
ncbi:MAG: helix-turn-helix domain-containing protein [Clostridium sp.]|nr:helix-turn-helix domain-containing protein [Clostridium sp.]